MTAFLWLAMLLKLYAFGRAAAIRHPSPVIVPATAGSVLLVTSRIPLVARRGARIAMFAVSLTVSLPIEADLFCFRYFGDLLTVPVLLHAGRFGALDGSITALFRPAELPFCANLRFLPAWLPPGDGTAKRLRPRHPS